jgi:hypothetical protein
MDLSDKFRVKGKIVVESGGDMASKKIKSGYQSEFTRFIDGYLAQHPDVVKEQKAGWYIYWDRHVEMSDIQRELTDNLPYVLYA